MTVTAPDQSTLSAASSEGQGEDPLAPLASLIELGLGKFTLATVRYRQPGQRLQVIAYLRGALPNITLVGLSLQDSSLDSFNTPRQLFQSLRRLADQHTREKPADVVLLIDWEKRLIQQNPPEHQPSTSLTGQFNIGRDILRQQFPCPFIILLPDWAAAIVKQLAPDLMSWRSSDFLVTDIRPGQGPTTRGATQQAQGDVEMKAWWEVFRGAAALTSDDPIFGRENDLLKVRQIVLDSAFRCGTIWGETGCGKTSFVRAGLKPQLKEAGHELVYLSEYTDPVNLLKKVLARRDPKLGVPGATLHETVKALDLSKGKLIFLLLDQFEQVYTEAILSRQGLKAFLKDLATCINDLTLPLCCILVVRADRLYLLYSDFDALTPLNHPLKDKRYELPWLGRGDAERVLTQLGERVGAAWPGELITAVLSDLTRDDLIKPVQIQLIATGLYLSNIATLTGYEQAGRHDGLLRHYLNRIFDTVSRPMLARRIVRELVLASDPPDRALLTAEEIAAALSKSTDQVETVLGELERYGLVSVRSADPVSTKPVRFELVHDVLIGPARQAAMPQEVGLHTIHTALIHNRRWLGPREYWRARRADLTELSILKQRNQARWLLYRSLFVLWGLALVVLYLLAAAIQFSFVHVDIDDGKPGVQPVMFHRGLPILDFLLPDSLPGLGTVPIADTGISFRHDMPRHNRSKIEGAWVSNWWAGVKSKAKLLLPYLHPEETGNWYCYLGDWEAGLEILASEQSRRGTEEQRIPAFVEINPEVAIPALARLFGDVRVDAGVRGVAGRALGEVILPEAQIPAVVDQLLDALAEFDLRVRDVAAEVLERITVPETQVPVVVDQLLNALAESDFRVRGAAARALGRITVPEAQVPVVVEKLLSALADPDPRVRDVAAEVLGKITVPEAQVPVVVEKLLNALAESDSRVRRSAARALGGITVPEAQVREVVKKLLSALADPDSRVRGAAAWALGRITVPEAQVSVVVEKLLTALADQRHWIRRAAAEALGEITMPEVQTLIVNQLLIAPANQPHWVRRAAARALGKITVPKAQTPAVVDRLLTALTDTDSEVRRAAAEALKEITVPKAQIPVVVDQLLTTLFDQSVLVPNAAARALGEITVPKAKVPAVVKKLLTALADQRHWVRRAAAEALGRITVPEKQVPAVIDHLLIALADTDSEVRQAAAKTLGKITVPEARVPAVVDQFLIALTDTDSEVRRAAAEALGKITVPEVQVPDVVDQFLTALIDDADSEVRRAAAEALREITVPEAQVPTVIDHLLTALADTDSEVRRAVAETLGEITVPEARVPAVEEKLFIALVDTDSEVRRAATEALREITVPETQVLTVIDHLLTALADADSKVRRVAAETLGEITVPEARVPAVKEKLFIALVDTDSEVRWAATEALGKISTYQWKSASPRELVKATQEKVAHKDPAVRTAAAKLLGQAKLAIVIRRSITNSNVFDSLLDQLTHQRKSRLNSGYRGGLVYALAYWYNAGRDDAGKQMECTANPSAKQEHKAFQHRLAELRDTGPLWQRAAIAQVWVTAFQLRNPEKWAEK